MLCMTGLVLLVPSGCKKEPEKPAAPSRKGVASVAERMADKEYVKRLDGQRDEMKKLAALAAKATTDVDRAAVTNALEANRQRTMQLIRERMRSGK